VHQLGSIKSNNFSFWIKNKFFAVILRIDGKKCEKIKEFVKKKKTRRQFCSKQAQINRKDAHSYEEYILFI